MTPAPSPVFEYATNRDFRERVWRVSQTIAAVGTKYDNSQIALETLKLRHEKAQMLGFKNHAEYVISDRMAEKPENVTAMLDRQREVYLPKAVEYRAKVDEFAKQDGGITDVKPWDRSFYARKLEEKEFDIDMEEVKAHFPLERVIAGLFAHEEKLFGVKAVENNDRAAYPVFHDDMRTFEIRDSKTDEIKSIFYADYLARPESGKRGGAWMDTFRVGGKRDGQWQIPLIINNLNLTKPEAGKPTLMTHDEVETLFHEKGHGSHGGLSEVEIPSLASPNVKWDAVEIPSQIQENWANEPEVIKTFAFHHETGAPLPDETIAKLDAMKKFSAGAVGLRQTFFADFDMKLHEVDPSTITDIVAFEDSIRSEYGDLMARADGANAMSNVFTHIFSGGYSAGYYGYALARVTDADMFEKGFKDTGDLYDPHHAQALKEYYAAGSAVHPADLARNFLGRNPDPDAVLRREGMLPPKTTATTATVVPPPTFTV
jgi:peptidyl-dipeptidase Dcp